MGGKIGGQGADGSAPACRWCRATTATTRTRRCLPSEAATHRLPGADQGQRRRRRQGHAHRCERRPTVRRGARRVPARGAARVRRRPRCWSRSYVTRPRHIEMQVFGDSHGNCVHLFERDCSVQRRHQKVLEEAPAPGMTRERRARDGRRPRSPRRSAVGYVGAGTVEFIAEQRRQLLLHGDEHPAAGRASGDRDDHRARPGRVAAARRRRRAAAAGAGVSCAIRGHAIEARLYAEDPGQGLPAVDRHAAAPAHAGAPSHTRTRRASTPACEQGDDDHPVLRPDDRQADRLGRRPRAGAGAHAQALAACTAWSAWPNNVEFLARLVGVPSFAQRRPRHRADRARARQRCSRRRPSAPTKSGCWRRWPNCCARPREAPRRRPARDRDSPWRIARRLAAERPRLARDHAAPGETLHAVDGRSRPAARAAALGGRAVLRARHRPGPTASCMRSSASARRCHAWWSRGERRHVFFEGRAWPLALSAPHVGGTGDDDEAGLTAPMPGKVIALIAARRRQRREGRAAAGAGSDEDGAHHQRAGRRHVKRLPLRAGRSGGRRCRTGRFRVGVGLGRRR